MITGSHRIKFDLLVRIEETLKDFIVAPEVLSHLCFKVFLLVLSRVFADLDFLEGFLVDLVIDGAPSSPRLDLLLVFFLNDLGVLVNIFFWRVIIFLG